MATTLTNPIKQIRLSNSLTLDEAAYHSGLHRQTIIRAEQGTFHEIPPNLLTYFSSLAKSSSTDISNRYREWVANQRRSNGPQSYDPVLLQVDTFPTLVHPFIWWREFSGVSSRVGIAKAFCVHVSTLSRFESDSLLSGGVPSQLREALIEAGYSTTLLDNLETAYKDYRYRTLAKRRNCPVGNTSSSENIISNAS